MNQKQIEKEWKQIKYELFINKPPLNLPYSSDIVRRRELLIFAQVHLNNISYAKLKNDKQAEKFETDIYNKITKTYYSW